MLKNQHVHLLKRIHRKNHAAVFPEQIIKNPWFFCSLCSKFLEFKDLADGYKCCFCDNDLFLISWKDYQKIKDKDF